MRFSDVNANQPIFVDISNQLYLDLSALTGEAVTDLSTSGVLKTVVVLHDLLREVQEDLNEAQETGPFQDAYPQPSYGRTSADGVVQVTRSIKAKQTLTTDIIEPETRR